MWLASLQGNPSGVNSVEEAFRMPEPFKLVTRLLGIAIVVLALALGFFLMFLFRVVIF